MGCPFHKHWRFLFSFLGAFEKLRKATISFIMYVCLSSWSNSIPTGRIFMKFDILIFENLTRITGTLHEDQYTFFIISRSFLLWMRNVLEQSCRENQNTHFMFGNVFFFENCAVYEIVWKNIVERGRPQMTDARCILST